MRYLLALLLLMLTLSACASAEHPTSLMTFTQPKNSGMSDDQSEAFFEGPAPGAGLVTGNGSAVQEQLQPTPPNLR